ncbi:MAG TPA: phosphatase PAP2 family protein [Thermoanaerobaculia bacterium]|nr:phosphatase PAP2 family protein [Thermoanaerobaculia bacterium]
MLANAAVVGSVLALRVGFSVPRSLAAQLPMLAVAGGLVAGGAGVRALALALAGGAARARLYLSRMTRPAALLDLARFVVALTLVSWSYSWLKVFVPHLNGWITDPLLAVLDFRIHFGVNPNRFLIELFPSPAFWRFLDVTYAQFILTMGVAFAWFGSALSRRDRGRFAAGFALLWIAGAWLYVAAPSLGPCYVFPEDFAAVRPEMPLQTQTQRLLLVQYDAVTKGSAALGKTGLNSAFGIAAMPSLHVAGQAFVAFFARRRSPRLAFLFGLFSALTFAGSLISGWHYAVDGYAGILLAFFAWRLGERMG